MPRALRCQIVLTTLLCTSIFGCKTHESDVRRSILRIVTADGQPRGTGFFIRGPAGDERVYVATAYHVIASGHALTIQRNADVQGDRTYVESYPEIEVVATDVKNDLALLVVKNLPITQVTPLPLAERPNRGEPTKSFGYPTTSLTTNVNVLDKDGKVATIEALASFDTLLPDQQIEANAIKGVIVDAQFMPGFSGGPTCNLAGEVIGVNFRRNPDLPEQGALVHVDALRDLIASVEEYQPPTKDDAQRLLGRLREEVLMLSLPERKSVNIETKFLSPSDLPMTWIWFTDRFKELERTEPSAFGLALAQLPGEVLPTYWSEETQRDLGECRLKNPGGRQSIMTAASSNDELRRTCDGKRLRTLLWDLTAATLHWDVSEAVEEYTIHRFEPIGNDKKLFKASISSGRGESFPVYFAWDHGGLRLKLWDQDVSLYVFSNLQRTGPQFFRGAWTAPEPKISLQDSSGTATTREHINITFEDDTRYAKVRYRMDVEVKQDDVFPCNGKRTLSGGYEQWFEAEYADGLLRTTSSKLVQADGDCRRDKTVLCNCPGPPDQSRLMLKARKSGLMVYRTDGINVPVEIEFQRGN